jgi:hypothetical protein
MKNWQKLISEREYDAWCGEPIVGANFDRLAMRAYESLDAATAGRLGMMLQQDGGIDDGWLMGQLKQACMAQIEYLYDNGVETALDGSMTVNGYNIGNTTVTVHANSKGGRTTLPGGLCRMAYNALALTGLLYAGANVRA